jgi:hypothetical protein
LRRCAVIAVIYAETVQLAVRRGSASVRFARLGDTGFPSGAAIPTQLYSLA